LQKNENKKQQLLFLLLPLLAAGIDMFKLYIEALQEIAGFFITGKKLTQ
jgi:hypothetical protein